MQAIDSESAFSVAAGGGVVGRDVNDPRWPDRRRQLLDERQEVMRAHARLHDQRSDVGVSDDLAQLATGDEGRDRHQGGAGTPDTERRGEPQRRVAGEQPDVRSRSAALRAQRLRPLARRPVERGEAEPVLLAPHRRPVAVALGPGAQQLAEIARRRHALGSAHGCCGSSQTSPRASAGSSANATETDQVRPNVQKLSAWWPDSPPATATRNCSGDAHSGTTPFST